MDMNKSTSVLSINTLELRQLGLDTIKELETTTGILASSRQEIYGCIFGRDSLISALYLLSAYQKNPQDYYQQLVKKILLNLAQLQGREVNVESGEEPGKCIHEFRTDNHDRLSKRSVKPWYVYDDGSLRNYDSLDSTSLFLIAIHRYWVLTGDQELLQQLLPNVRAGLDWIFKHGDSNDDGFLDYYLNPQRQGGGLVVQNWMDSSESLFHEDGTAVQYPIAPVEVQAYAYVALREWGLYFKDVSAESTYATVLLRRARRLKRNFNQKFVWWDSQMCLYSGIDGAGRGIKNVRSSMGHCLWAITMSRQSILAKRHIPALVQRLLADDLFEPTAGIRTLSRHSSRFQANSYHNGSIWVHDTGMILEGLRNFGFYAEAERVAEAMARAISHFRTPLELFSYDGQYEDYVSANGQRACLKQAWSAASLLIL
jgi:glycogen debranching enzyme